MNNFTYYYRFEAVGIDFSSEKEIRKYNQKLVSFSDVSQQLDKMRYAYDNLQNERADVIINALPDVCGVAEIAVFHEIKRKLFSRQVKINRFSICLSKYDQDGKLSLYFTSTCDFSAVETILRNFVQNAAIPDLRSWQCSFIG
ncbi:MAG: hypothetical protein NC132_04345 [Corallococcus sp.]|nr:hypothetical protein [Corallococcus sp.]MCM1359890.1 hypothetical protein [Corallococcus sp.]MCM1395324.1 hypothetical protein [Corallococcus sp.]